MTQTHQPGDVVEFWYNGMIRKGIVRHYENGEYYINWRGNLMVIKAVHVVE